MTLFRGLIAAVLLITLNGCQSAPKVRPQPETMSALSTVTEGLTNKTITEQQLKRLGEEVARDPQAQSALRSINTALSPVHTVKYCPENGERFSAQMEWCPDHKVKLEWVN